MSGLSIESIKVHCHDVLLKDAVQDVLNYGMLSIRSVNQTLKDASSKPNPRSLFMELWHEGEIGCLFADSGVGKSILAVQMGMEIAKTDIVLYIDCELTEIQFKNRYISEYGELAEFPDNMFRSEINPYAIYDGDYESTILANIESSAIGLGANVIIIDNLTYLCNNSEKGDSAGRFMMNLMQLKKRHGWSVLVIAHTPKRNLSSPITANDLAGSKKLYNFFDCVFALGRSATEGQVRYLKQLKVRVSEQKYGADNVIVYELIKDGAMTKLEHIGFGKESDYLADIPSDGARQTNGDKIVAVMREGVNYKHKELIELANGLGINENSTKYTISSLMKKGIIRKNGDYYSL